MQKEFFRARARSVERVTPSMIRVGLGGGDLDQFETNGTSDEWVRLYFPPANVQSSIVTAAVDVERLYEKEISWPARPYTVRRWNPLVGEMTIDFVVHDGGVAARWAACAKVGDEIGIGFGGGRFDPTFDADWFCLLSDITGLPAVGRILEELPSGKRVFAHIEIPYGDDRQEIDSHADVSITWHESFGIDGTGTRLSEIARTISLPDGAGYIWVAGEATAAADSRSYFRDISGFDKERIRSVGYWIEGQARG